MDQEHALALGAISAGNLLTTAARRFAEREALLCAGTGRRFTYRELDTRSNQLAQALLARGLARDTVVAFLCTNRSEIAEIYFAIAKSGLIGLPLNYRLAPVELASLMNAMGARVLICEASVARELEGVRAACPQLALCVWIGAQPPAGCIGYEDLLASGRRDAPRVRVREADPFYFNLTSGTTGLPKSYLLNHYQAAMLQPGMLAFELRPDDVFLTVFPAFGRVGFGWLCAAIVLGTRSVLANFDAAEAVRLIEREAVTFTMLVPTMASMLLSLPDLDSRRLASLRCISFAGSMLPAAIREQAQKRLCHRLSEGYGLQEAGWLTISTVADRERKPDSVGKPVLFAEVRIVGANGRDLPAGAIGEIVGRSPMGVTGYFQSPGKNAESFRDGWFHTGDLGRFDEDGYLYICGRVKDMIISGGQNVHSAEVEAVLLALPGVAECAVIGVPDDVWGERVTAVVVMRGAAPRVEEVQDFCRHSLAGFKVPRRVHFQPEALPRTPTGKVQKYLLVERYRSA